MSNRACKHSYTYTCVQLLEWFVEIIHTMLNQNWNKVFFILKWRSIRTSQEWSTKFKHVPTNAIAMHFIMLCESSYYNKNNTQCKILLSKVQNVKQTFDSKVNIKCFRMGFCYFRQQWNSNVRIITWAHSLSLSLSLGWPTTHLK